MEQQTRHPFRDEQMHNQAHEQQVLSDSVSASPAVDGTLKTHPIDGSQYIDVVDEQEYADRRPSAEEQKPRFSYLHNDAQAAEDGEQPE